MTDLLKVLNSFTYQTTEIDVVQSVLRCLLLAQAGKNRYTLSLAHAVRRTFNINLSLLEVFFLPTLDARHHVLNPENIVKDAVAFSPLLVIGSSPGLFHNFGKRLRNSRSLHM